jgi:hypothetical protein
MPEITSSLERTFGRMMEAYFIFTGTPMPDRHRTLAARL